VVSLAIAAALTAFWVSGRNGDEPRYKDRPISYWFGESFKYRGKDLTGRRSLAAAARAMGEPAVPFLLSQTRYRQGFIKTKWLQLAPQLPEFVQRFVPRPPSEDLVRGAAYAGLIDMGPLAKSAVPELIIVFQRPPNDPATSDHILRATWVFESIGPEARDAVPCLVSFLGGALKSNRDESLLEQTIHALKKFGPEARTAVPLLLSYIENTNGRLGVAAALALWKIDGQTNLALRFLESALDDKADYTVVVAIKALREMEAPDPIVLPRMLALLDHSNSQVKCEAAYTLGDRRAASAMAIPRLTELLGDEDQFVHSSVQSALMKVRPAPELTIRAFEDLLLNPKQEASRRAEAASLLGELGKEATSAIPALGEALSDQDETVRLNAAFSLWSLDHQHLDRSLPILVRQLKGADEFLVYRAAIYLGEMGAAAHPAIPALEAARHRRFESFDATYEITNAIANIRNAENGLR
jgi:HEAT repeat protein